MNRNAEPHPVSSQDHLLQDFTTFNWCFKKYVRVDIQGKKNIFFFLQSCWHHYPLQSLYILFFSVKTTIVSFLAIKESRMKNKTFMDLFYEIIDKKKIYCRTKRHQSTDLVHSPHWTRKAAEVQGIYLGRAGLFQYKQRVLQPNYKKQQLNHHTLV